MEGFDRRAIKKLAARQVSGKKYYKQIFLHALVVLGFGALVTGVNFTLQQGIGSTGGLSGLGTRSILETVQAVLQYANTLLVPFWQIGILCWAIRRARGSDTGFSDFAEGFRRFGPVLRLKLLTAIVVFCILFACTMLSSVIFALSPLAFPMIEVMLPYMDSMENLYTAMADPAVMEQLIACMYPVYIILAVLLIPTLGPLYYRFRMAEYVLMDKPRTGAIQALIHSFRMTRKQWWHLMKLDLSYWWYWALDFLAMTVLYLDLLLPALGVCASGSTLTIFSYAGYFVLQLASITLFRGKVETTYALAYNAMNACVPETKPLFQLP